MGCIRETIKKAKNRLRDAAHGDSAFADLIRFSYKAASHNYSQAVVSILETIVLSVFIERGYWGVFFWIAIAVYLLLTIMIAWAHEHIKEKIRDTHTFQRALFGISAVLRAWSIGLQKSAKSLNKIDVKKDILARENSLTQIDIQTAAFTVCEKLHDFLASNRSPDDVYVTIFQRYEANEQDMCRMIAYSGSHEPTSYTNEYAIPTISNCTLGKIEYHTYKFASGNKEITIFANQAEVNAAFAPHKGCEEREGCIHQYMCIPISPAKMGVTFLLQVDTTIAGLFGNNKTAVAEFAKNTVFPFAQFLHMIYEQARVVDVLIK